MHTSKAAIVEEAVRYYTKNQITGQSALMNYVGILNKQTAEKMLAVIKTSRKNKDVDSGL